MRTLQRHKKCGFHIWGDRINFSSNLFDFFVLFNHYEFHVAKDFEKGIRGGGGRRARKRRKKRSGHEVHI